jgi:uncharacterized protein YndB with AHSA1/START domain
MSSMAKLTRSITIDAPVEKVFDYASDIARLWAWPDVALTDVEIKPGGVGTSARMYSHVMGFHVEGVAEYTEVVPNERIVARVTFLGEHPTWSFTFAHADGGTMLTAQGEWHVGVPAVGKTIEGWLVKEHEEGLEALLARVKARVEAEQPARTG